MKMRADNLPREVNYTVRRAALAIDQTLVMSTPVDTGQARSNWNVSTGAPQEQIVEPVSAGAAIARGAAVINGRRSEETIFITNNVPYIGRLNEGSSAQAPAMFVEGAIAAGVAAVQNARIDTGRKR
jgi:hypothetical protein